MSNLAGSIDGAKICVVTSNRSVRRHVTRALVSAGSCVTHVVPDRVALETELAQDRDLFIVDADEDRASIEWLLREIAARQEDAAALVLSQDHTNRFLIDLIIEDSLNNLIARHGGVTASPEMIDENELIVTCSKLYTRDIFGIKKYLPTWGIKVYEHPIQHSKDKVTAIGQLEDFLKRIDCHAAIVPEISTVADELLMNAIFNAPRDQAGNPKYRDVARRADIQLQPTERITFRYACDGRHVAISVSDPFGSLQRNVIVNYIKQCFLGGQAQIEEKKAGAGLGLYMVFNSVTQLTFNIHEGTQTEVVALFYVRSGARVFKTSGRSLNMFLLRDPR